MINPSISQLLMSLLFLTLLSGCAVTNNFGPYMGKVVDAETQEPIEGAVVFMRCVTLTGNPGGSESHYMDAKEVLTDEKGEFNIELRTTTLRPGHLWDYPQFIIFKPEYGVFPDHRESGVDILIKDTSHIFPEDTYVTIALPKLNTPKERKDNLMRIYVPSEEEIPFEKRQHLFRLNSIERVNLGLKPYVRAN